MPIRPARERIRTGKKVHPMLVGRLEHRIVFKLVSKNPGITRADVGRITAIHPQVASDLVNEGLLIEGPRKGRSHTLHSVPENAVGLGRDKVEVRVDIYKNEYGEFSIKAKLVGEMPGATEGITRKVASKKLTVYIPRDSEPQCTRMEVEDIGESPDPTIDTELDEPLTLEGESLTLLAKT